MAVQGYLNPWSTLIIFSLTDNYVSCMAKQWYCACVFSGTAVRQHRAATSLERLSLFETATLQNSALGNKQKCVDDAEFELGRAEYIGISLPADITRFFQVTFTRTFLLTYVRSSGFRL
jgi:hypothetical protein